MNAPGTIYPPERERGLMSRTNGRCTVCRHPERFRVELAMAAGVALQALGRKYGLNRRALDRHSRNHVTEERRAQLVAGPVKLHELAERAAEMGMSLVDYTNLVLSVLLTQFTAAGEAGDRVGTAMLAWRVTEVLRLQATLTGDLQRAGAVVTNNTLVLASPVMAELVGLLERSLEPYPEAAEAVLAAIRQFRDRALNGARAQLAPVAPLTLEAKTA
jgi:hypothetical protein